jgi:hypothetical protein
MLPPDRPQPAATPGEDWLTAPLPADAFEQASQEVRDFVARKGMPQPTACFSQRLKLTGGIDSILRKTYIYCSDPEPTTFTPFSERLKNKPGWTVQTLPCTHFAQMDMPDELTALLLEAAA